MWGGWREGERVMGVATSPAGRRWSRPACTLPPRRKQAPRFIALCIRISHKFSKVSLTRHCECHTLRVSRKDARENGLICGNRRRVWILHWRQPGLSCFPPNAATRKPLWGVAYAGSPALSFYYRLLFRWWLIRRLKKSSKAAAFPMSAYVDEKRVLYEIVSTGQTSNNNAADAPNRWVEHTWFWRVFRRTTTTLSAVGAPCCNNNNAAAVPPSKQATTTHQHRRGRRRRYRYRCVLYNMMRSRGSTKCLLPLHHTRLSRPCRAMLLSI